MTIESTYRDIYISDYIKDRLSRGENVTAESVIDVLTEELNEVALSVPQFIASDHYATEHTSSSASDFQSTFLAIRQDLRVLYKELIALNSVNQRTFERWDLEARNIEKKLVDLEERIENLLLLTQDTEGYHSILVDNFTDTTQVDIDHTTAEMDLASASVEMAIPSDSGVNTRIFLNDLTVNKDVFFKVRTTVDLLSRVDAVSSALTDIFAQQSKTWWTSVNMKTQKPVTCELQVRLDPNSPVSISKIFMELHDSTESSPVYITPLYSTDNRNWVQLPTTTYTIEARTTAVFTFKQVEAQYVKFLLQKRGPDPSSATTHFSYQFGFKNIIFYQQSFDTETASVLVSEPLYVLNTSGAVKGFEKLTLETCEKVETDTDIKYYLTVSNDSTVPLDSDSEPTDGTWIPVSPIQRVEQLYPYIVNIGDTIGTTIGDTEEDDTDDEILKVSYDGRISPTGDDEQSDFVNPAADFKLLYKDPSSGAITSEDRSASSVVRYNFINSNERILNYQIKDTDSGTSGTALEVDPSDFIIFRNVGKKGFTPLDVSSQVRDIQRGWKFEDPYYSCVIEIENPEGITIDFGDKKVIIDDTVYSNVVDNTVLTGKSGIIGNTDYNSGVHTVKVHKNNWKEIAPGLTTLASLKTADLLYPYNHKLLIEGYDYGSTYPDTSEKIYKGVNLFAETVMTPVSVFDLTTNIPSDRYDLYALDKDAPNSHDSPDDDNDPTTVILIKVDESNPDFQNERFVLRFTLINELRYYLRLKAELTTEDDQVTPALHSYKIKLG